MVHRDQATGGPSYGSLDLIYARVGGVTVVSAPEVSFSLALDKSVYGSSPRGEIPEMSARLALRNTQPEPLELSFPSGQIYDVAIRNESGVVVYRWSDGKAFPAIFQTISFSAEKNWPILLRPADKDGKPLPPGKYTAEGYLTTAGPKSYSAAVAFEMR